MVEERRTRGGAPQTTAACVLVAALLLAAPCRADDDPFAALRRDAPAPAPAPAPAGPRGLAMITRNLRGAVEGIGRAGASFPGASPAGAAGLGVEVFTRVVTPRGTWGSFDAQLRWMWTSETRAMDIEIHNLELEKRLLFGRLNLRVGHFQAPFGLEALPLDTHTTLLQLSNPRVLGIKHDWGLGVRGQLDGLDYDLAYTLGAGMEPAFVGAGMFTGRLGWEDAGTGLGFGVSGLAGERRPMMMMNARVFGWRTGLDLRWSYGPVELMTEGSAGEDDGATAGAALLRLGVTTSDRMFSAALQGLYTRVDGRPQPDQVRAETELALRLPWITTDSFLRLDVAWEGGDSPGAWIVMTQLYLRFDA
jgi:hypothetical protein